MAQHAGQIQHQDHPHAVVGQGADQGRAVPLARRLSLDRAQGADVLQVVHQQHPGGYLEAVFAVDVGLMEIFADECFYGPDAGNRAGNVRPSGRERPPVRRCQKRDRQCSTHDQ